MKYLKIFIIYLCLTNLVLGTGFPRYFYKIQNKKQQKQEFVKILLPLIKNTNTNILKEREAISKFLKNRTYPTPKNILKIKNKYKINNLTKYNALTRIDTIPVSLALAQAAIESGWGKSHFVKVANNIFGHWTYGKKGIIPKHRSKGKIHKIRIFDSLQDSINAYALNLNTNMAYKDFRAKRAKYKSSNRKYTGQIASQTMINYSAIKEKYIKLLKNVIKQNHFHKFD